MALPSTHLTGNARFRRTWTGKLILQVERRIYRDRAVKGAQTEWVDASESELPTLRLVRQTKKLEPLL